MSMWGDDEYFGGYQKQSTKSGAADSAADAMSELKKKLNAAKGINVDESTETVPFGVYIIRNKYTTGSTVCIPFERSNKKEWWAYKPWSAYVSKTKRYDLNITEVEEADLIPAIKADLSIFPEHIQKLAKFIDLGVCAEVGGTYDGVAADGTVIPDISIYKQENISGVIVYTGVDCDGVEYQVFRTGKPYRDGGVTLKRNDNSPAITEEPAEKKESGDLAANHGTAPDPGRNEPAGLHLIGPDEPIPPWVATIYFDDTDPDDAEWDKTSTEALKQLRKGLAHLGEIWYESVSAVPEVERAMSLGGAVRSSMIRKAMKNDETNMILVVKRGEVYYCGNGGKTIGSVFVGKQAEVSMYVKTVTEKVVELTKAVAEKSVPEVRIHLFCEQASLSLHRHLLDRLTELEGVILTAGLDGWGKTNGSQVFILMVTANAISIRPLLQHSSAATVISRTTPEEEATSIVNFARNHLAVYPQP